MSACKFSGQVLVPLSQLLGCGVRAPMFKNDQTQRSPNLIISMQLATGHDSHSWWVSIGVLSRSLSRPCAQDLGGKPAVAWTAADERLEVLLHGACLITGHFCQILYISINLYIYTRTYIYIYTYVVRWSELMLYLESLGPKMEPWCDGFRWMLPP